MRWLRHTDGRCHGLEYYDEHPECKPALTARAAQLAETGRFGKVPQNGHPLKGKWRDLIELKPGDHRFMGFRHGDVFYITNGAPKDAKKQQRDWDFALKIREAFLKRVGA